METERVNDYLFSLESENDPVLYELRKKAETDRVPIIRRQSESFLSLMIKILKPENILELGTATGFSSIVMMKAAKESGLDKTRITTVENYEKRIPEAIKNFKALGYENDITLIKGDAGAILKEFVEGSRDIKSFDMIFLDAAKGQYMIWLPDIMSLMHKGSVLIADNVLQDETVMESRYTVERRDRTTHSRMREFLYEIKHNDRLESSVFPVGDGMSMSLMI